MCRSRGHETCSKIWGIIMVILVAGCVVLFALSIVYLVQSNNNSSAFESTVLTVTGYQAYNQPCSTCSRRKDSSQGRLGCEIEDFP